MPRVTEHGQEVWGDILIEFVSLVGLVERPKQNSGNKPIPCLLQTRDEMLSHNGALAAERLEKRPGEDQDRIQTIPLHCRAGPARLGERRKDEGRGKRGGAYGVVLGVTSGKTMAAATINVQTIRTSIKKFKKVSVYHVRQPRKADLNCQIGQSSATKNKGKGAHERKRTARSQVCRRAAGDCDARENRKQHGHETGGKKTRRPPKRGGKMMFVFRHARLRGIGDQHHVNQQQRMRVLEGHQNGEEKSKTGGNIVHQGPHGGQRPRRSAIKRAGPRRIKY